MKNNNSGVTESYWMDGTEISFEKPLKNDLKADVCIIGAGITGLTCAYTLAKQGKKVVIIDSGTIAGGQTARTTAHLTFILDDHFSDLKSLFGLNGARLAAESHRKAIDYVEHIVKEEKIACHFKRVPGFLFGPPQDKKIIEQEAQTFEEMGNVAFQWIDKAPFENYDTGACLMFPEQAEFYILEYLKGLVKAILNLGGEIYTHTHAKEISENDTCLVVTKHGNEIHSNYLIVATNSPVNDRLYIHTKQAAYRTYVIGVQVPKGTIERGLYWDTLDPYHYIRVVESEHATKEILLIGGEDHRTGQNDHNNQLFTKLEKWAKHRFPVEKVLYQWSGQVLEPIDSLAFCGKNPGNKNVYIHTGDSGNGLTHGTIAGILIPDLINAKENPWQNLYSPSRTTIKATGEFIKENGNTAWQYRDWVTSGEVDTVEQIKNNEGAILRQGLEKKAVYRDEEGKLHCSSATCPHLGGIVRWNSVEKTWDCPCHGSRFTAEGTVIEGPAKSNLHPM